MRTLETLNKLKQILSDDQILINEPLAKHTTFKIGGPADFLVLPETIGQIKALLSEFEKPFILGNGSNLLVSDKGIRGVVIKLASNFSDIKVSGDIIEAQCGALLSKVAKVALEHSLSGLEFASGIPGTLGGGVYMNAGAYGGELKDVVISSKYITPDGEIKEITDHGFSYRKSVFSGTDNIILSSKIKLFPNCYDEIRETMSDLAKRRQEKQPVHLPSAGSTFKRPEGHFAGKLIEDAGLKGYRIGGACVSEKHSGFVVNDQNATFSDVYSLINHIKKTVYEKFGVMLEEEVKICGL